MSHAEDVDLIQRWPVYVRFGDNAEAKVADVFAQSTSELLAMMAAALRDLADELEERASRV